MKPWVWGYTGAAAALALPTIARFTAANTDPVDAAMFFVVGVAVWGSVAAGVLHVFSRRRQAPAPAQPGRPPEA